MKAYKLINEIVQDSNKAFIRVESFKIPKEQYPKLTECIVDTINNPLYNNAFTKAKFAEVLAYLCNESGIRVKDFIKQLIVKYPDTPVTDKEYARWKELNGKLQLYFTEDKDVFELLKYITGNNIYSITTALLYINWMYNNNIFKDISAKDILDRLVQGEAFEHIVNESNATYKCKCCNKVLKVKHIGVGRTKCKFCKKLETSGEQAAIEYKNDKECEEILEGIEIRIDKFKSADTEDMCDESSIEDRQSVQYVRYEGVYNTIINNLFELLELDLSGMYEHEKHKVISNNNDIINIISQVEDKLWYIKNKEVVYQYKNHIERI